MAPHNFSVRPIAKIGADSQRQYIFSKNKAAVLVLSGDDLLDMTRECMIATEIESSLQAKEARQKRSGNER